MWELIELMVRWWAKRRDSMRRRKIEETGINQNPEYSGS